MENSHAMKLSHGNRSGKQEEVAFVRLESGIPSLMHTCTYSTSDSVLLYLT